MFDNDHPLRDETIGDRAENEDAFECALAKRYKRLSLLTLDIAAAAGDAAMDAASSGLSNGGGGDRGAEFKGFVATMTRATWAHNVFERLRHGGARKAAQARPSSPTRSADGRQGSAPRPIGAPTIMAGETRAADFATALASIGAIGAGGQGAGSKPAEPFADDEEILANDFDNDALDDDAIDKDVLAAAIEKALRDDKNGAATLMAAIGADPTDGAAETAPDPSISAGVRAPP